MSEAFRIPKEPARVTVWVPPDPPARRLLFLSPTADHHMGTETVWDLLGRPKRFLPLVEEGVGVRLVRKESIRWIRVEEPAKHEWHYLEERDGAPRLAVEIQFAHGPPLEGIVWVLTPPGEQRLLDVVNLEHGFLHLVAETGLYLVNLEHVTWIGEKGENDGGTR